MRVTLFISSLHAGGTQRQSLLLAAGLSGADDRVELLTTYPGGKFWEEAAGLEDIDVHSIFPEKPVSKLARIFGHFWAPVRLRQYLSANRPDVIYSILDVSNLIARLATLGLRRGPMLIWGIRASARQAGARAAIVQWLCRFLSRGVPLVIANSNRGLAGHADMGFRFRQSIVVHNGIDTRQFCFDDQGRRNMRERWGILDNEVLVGLVGRIDPMKGPDVFVKMAARLKEKHSALRFICVEPEASTAGAELLHLAEQQQLPEHLQVVTGVEDMKQVYSAMDIVVSASLAEGFPNVIGEAMACGRACVVTDVGDTGVLVGDCGLMVPANDVQGLANAVSRALDRRQEMGECGVARIAQHFSIDAMTSKTRQALESAISA